MPSGVRSGVLVEATTGFEPVNRGFADPNRAIMVAMNEPKQPDPAQSKPNQSGVRSGVPTTLYRFFDLDGALLYIGITSAGANRWSEHERHRAWWVRMASSTSEHFPDRASASAAEVAAIKAERPPFNVRHTVERTPKPARTYRKRGTGTVMWRPDRDRWVVVPPPQFRGWYHFRTEEQARAFLDLTVALVDPDLLAAVLRMVAKQ